MDLVATEYEKTFMVFLGTALVLSLVDYFAYPSINSVLYQQFVSLAVPSQIISPGLPCDSRLFCLLFHNLADFFAYPSIV